MFKVMITSIVVCFLLLSSNPAHGTIIKVPQNQPTIQAGIDNAVNGDVVLVSQGTYNESTISFDGKAITVMSKDPLDPAVVAATIVDCGSIMNEYVFVFTSEENLSSVLAGFTITGGEGPGGGGIFCGASSSPTIAYNIITGNSGQHGGGINCFQSSPRILNNTIAENTASDDGGGGIHLTLGSDMTISNTILWDNYAPEGAEIWMGSVSQPSILTISYSNVSGVPTSVHIEPGSTVNRGPGNISADPFFITYQGLEYFLGQGSPCIDAGDPGILDACRPPGLGGERSDMGVYGGENNCGWLP